MLVLVFQCSRLVTFLFCPQKLGVLALIDEESNFPKGTDESMLVKLHSSHEVCFLFQTAVFPVSTFLSTLRNSKSSRAYAEKHTRKQVFAQTRLKKAFSPAFIHHFAFNFSSTSPLRIHVSRNIPGH